MRLLQHCTSGATPSTARFSAIDKFPNHSRASIPRSNFPLDFVARRGAKLRADRPPISAKSVFLTRISEVRTRSVFGPAVGGFSRISADECESTDRSDMSGNDASAESRDARDLRGIAHAPFSSESITRGPPKSLRRPLAQNTRPDIIRRSWPHERAAYFIYARVLANSRRDRGTTRSREDGACHDGNMPIVRENSGELRTSRLCSRGSRGILKIDRLPVVCGCESGGFSVDVRVFLCVRARLYQRVSF